MVFSMPKSYVLAAYTLLNHLQIEVLFLSLTLTFKSYDCNCALLCRGANNDDPRSFVLGKFKDLTKLLMFLDSQILQCLTVQGSNSSGGPIGGDGSGSQLSRAGVKDRFKTFNTQFEELHQRQSQWTVPDSELRESLRLAVAEILLPAYRSFLKRHGHVFSILVTSSFLEGLSFFFFFFHLYICVSVLQASD
jgi:hypothetical protein